MASGSSDDSYTFYIGRVGEGTTTTIVAATSPVPFPSSTSSSPPAAAGTASAAAGAAAASAPSMQLRYTDEEMDDLTVVPFDDDDDDDDDSETQRRKRRSQNLGNRLRTSSLDRCFEYFQHQQRQRRKSQGDTDGDDGDDTEEEEDQKPSAVPTTSATSTTPSASDNNRRNNTGNTSKGTQQQQAQQPQPDSSGRMSTITDSTATSSSFSADALSPGSTTLSVRVGGGPSLPSTSSFSSSTPASAPSPSSSSGRAATHGSESSEQKGNQDNDADTRNMSLQQQSPATRNKTNHRYRYEDSEGASPTPPPPPASSMVRHASDSAVESEKQKYRDAQRHYTPQPPQSRRFSQDANGGDAATPSQNNAPHLRGRSALVTPTVETSAPPPSKKRARSRNALRNFDFSAPLFSEGAAGMDSLVLGLDSSPSLEFFENYARDSCAETQQEGERGLPKLERPASQRKEQPQEHHSRRHDRNHQQHQARMYSDEEGRNGTVEGKERDLIGYDRTTQIEQDRQQLQTPRQQYREQRLSREIHRATPGEHEERSSSRLAETGYHLANAPSDGGRHEGGDQFPQQPQQRQLYRNRNRNDGSNSDLADITGASHRRRHPHDDSFNAEDSPHQRRSHRRVSSLPRSVTELHDAVVGEHRRQVQQQSSQGGEAGVSRTNRSYRESGHHHQYAESDEQNQRQWPSRRAPRSDGQHDDNARFSTPMSGQQHEQAGEMQDRDMDAGRPAREPPRSSPNVTRRDPLPSAVKAKQQYRPSSSQQLSPSMLRGGELENMGKRGHDDGEKGNVFHPPAVTATHLPWQDQVHGSESPSPRERQQRQRRLFNRIRQGGEDDTLANRMRQGRPLQLPVPPMLPDQTPRVTEQQTEEYHRRQRQSSLPPTGRHQQQLQHHLSPTATQRQDQEYRRSRSNTSGSGSSGTSNTSNRQHSGSGEWERKRNLHQRMSTLLDTIAQATEGLDAEVAERLRQSALEEKRLAGDDDDCLSPAQPHRSMMKQSSQGNTRSSTRPNLNANDRERKEIPVTSTPPHSRGFIPRRQPSKFSTGTSISSLTPCDYSPSQANPPTGGLPPPPLPTGRGRGPAISFGNGSFRPFQPRGGAAAFTSTPPSTGRSQVAVDSYNRHNNTVIVGMSRNNNSTSTISTLRSPSSSNLQAMATTGTPPVKQRQPAFPSSSNLSPSPMASPPTVKSTSFQAIAFTPVSSSTSSADNNNKSATRSGSTPKEQHLIIHSEQYKSLVHRPYPVRAQPSAFPPPPPIAPAKSLSSTSLAAMEMRFQAQQRLQRQEANEADADHYRRDDRRFDPTSPRKQASPIVVSRARNSGRTKSIQQQGSQQQLSPSAVQVEMDPEPRTPLQQPKELLKESHAHSSQVTVVTRGAGPRGGELLGFEGEASNVDSGGVASTSGMGGNSILDPTSRCPPLDQDMKRIHDNSAENRIFGLRRRRRRSFSIVKETVAARLALRRSKQLKPTDSASSFENDVINHLVKEGFTFGLANTLVRNCDVFTMRLWLLDNSGSMSSTDGHRIVDSPKGSKPSIPSLRNGSANPFRKRFSGGGNQPSPNSANNNIKIVSCSRWEEVSSTVMWHAQISAMLRAPIVFRLLNDPGAPLKQQVSVAETAASDVDDEVRLVRETMRKARPIGHTPLTFHLQEVYRSLLKMKDRLQSEHKLVSLVIVTDGLPTDESGRETDAASDEFFRVLRLFEGLPVWIVIRLSTDEERVINFYNAIDDTIHTAGYELDVDVLDDFMGEAVEVYRQNPWLNYALPLHLSRESGMNFDAMDALDERPLELRELRELCCLLFDIEFGDESAGAAGHRQGGGGETRSESPNSSTLPDPVEDYHGFSKQLRRILKKECPQWNPIREKMMPWIDVKELDRIYGHIHADVESLSEFGGSRSGGASTEGDSSLRSNNGSNGRRSRLSKGGDGEKCSIM